jgi:23S rRNA pseudouridine2605 synthase
VSARVLLPRWISRCGAASRRAAEQAVVDGRVTVDGAVVRDVLRAIDPSRARVALDGLPVAPAALRWIALNKPRGVVSTTSDPEGRETVLDLIGAWRDIPGIAPVGRLDRDTGGLLLLTNDHTRAAALLDPASHVEKRYRAKVRGHPAAEALARLAGPIEDRGERLGPIRASVAATNPASTWLDIALCEGKNRQIRRMMAAVGHPVEVLIREAFGPIALGDLAPGAVRPLTAAELSAVGSSS